MQDIPWDLSKSSFSAAAMFPRNKLASIWCIGTILSLRKAWKLPKFAILIMERDFCLRDLEELHGNETSRNEYSMCSNRSSALTSRSLTILSGLSLHRMPFASPRIVRGSHEIVVPQERKVATARTLRRVKTIVVNNRVIPENLLFDRLDK